MGGGGDQKKVISEATAQFWGKRHAWGTLKGFLRILEGIWALILRVAELIKYIYTKVKKLIREKFDFLFDLIRKLQKLYNDYIKPILDTLTKTINDLYKLYKVFRALVLGKINELFDIVFGPIMDDIKRLDKALSHLQEIFSAFSKKMADAIRNLRKETTQFVIQKVNEMQNNIIRWTLDKFTPLDKFFNTIESFKRDHIDPLQEGMKGLQEDLGLVLDEEKKPKEEFAWESGNLWGTKLFDEIFGRYIEGQKIVEVLPPEEMELYKEMQEVEEELKKETEGVFAEYLDMLEKSLLPLTEIVR